MNQQTSPCTDSPSAPLARPRKSKRVPSPLWNSAMQRRGDGARLREGGFTTVE